LTLEKGRIAKILFAYALILSCLLGLFATEVTASGTEEITHFHSSIQIQPSGAVVVTETITANCLGKRIRHGIYRDLPIKYKKGGFLSFKPHFKIIGVYIDGNRAPYHTKDLGSHVRIYMGSKNRFISKGPHTFQLIYEMGRMVSYFDEFDELYWNVTGDQWAFPILKATVTVMLPEPSRFLRYASYTGPRGAKETMAKVTEVTGRHITFETTMPIYPREGFTIAVAWPKGVVEEPDNFQKFLLLLKDNFSLISSIFLLVCIFFYYLYAWNQVGKDPELGPIVPRFDPPQGIGPAAARFVRQMGFDDKVFATALVDLGVQGAVIIKKDSNGYTVERADGGVKKDLPDGEDKLLLALFRSRPVVRLSQQDRKSIVAARDQLKEALKRRYEKLYFLTNRHYLIPGLALSALAMILLALGGREIIPSLFITVWLTVWAFFSTFLVITGAKGLKGLFRIPWKQKAAVVGHFVFSLFFLIGLVGGGSFYYAMIGPVSLVILVCIVTLNIVFYHLMKAPTMQGTKLLSHLEGFRMFLKTAEAPRLQALTPPDKAPELFERYLPWAMALDVENDWAERFQEYLKQIGKSETSYTPVWYHGSYNSLTSLSSDIGTGLNSVISSASVSTSSGSGRGGFSGGGGGGGGGGGW